MTTQLTETPTKQAPAFFSYFSAMDAYIKKHGDLTRWQPKKLKPCEVDVNALSKLLLNSWSAEYALRITPVVNDEQYLQSSLHWTFPQAYYAVLFSARAFLLVQGNSISKEENIRRKISRYVYQNYYPKSIGYSALDTPPEYTFHRLAPNKLMGLLENTRTKQFRLLFNAIQSNPKAAFRLPSSGKPLVVMNASQATQLAKVLGGTTYFDLLSRLRISSTNREVEQLVESELDVRTFHKHLVSIASHVAQVHEMYVAQVIGERAYRQLVAKLPSYLQESFVRERMNQIFDNQKALI